MRAKFGLLIVASLAMVGCGSSGSSGTPSASTATSTSASSSTPGAASRSTPGAASSSTTGAASSGTPGAASSSTTGAWTGFGAKLADWASARPKGSIVNGSGCSGVGCYGNKVTSNEESVREFTSLSTTGPPEKRVDGYEQALSDGTGISAAKEAVLKLMPSDTVPVEFFVQHQGGSCALWNLTSATLGHWFGADRKVRDSQGAVGVVFESPEPSKEPGPTYDPSDVTRAIVGIAREARGVPCGQPAAP